MSGIDGQYGTIGLRGSPREAELAAFREGLAALGLTYDQLTACLGGACYDVSLSDLAYWRCVPARVSKCAKAVTR